MPVEVEFNPCGNRKNPLEGILEIVDVMGVKKENVIFIGDASTDMISGKKAGVKTGLIMRKKNYPYKGPEPDMKTDDMKDFIRWEELT